MVSFTFLSYIHAVGRYCLLYLVVALLLFFNKSFVVPFPNIRIKVYQLFLNLNVPFTKLTNLLIMDV